ncbi:F-box protein At3g12350 isoform X1 [Mangifera indica]|uniref:F-box protein At3g12350 isoform X1 n=1 Tax=Mangifera indica TaxID=29780 RepID=UPI001CF9907F|nr:F-box protein At3g12350 isoform X1 [Mangifera indica]
MAEMNSFSFSDFPEDIQLIVLSFLTPREIANFACTSKRFVSLCKSDGKLWYTICDRRWGSKTQIKKWGDGKISYKLLYKTLSEWENLIGFWRRSGQPMINFSSPPLIFFEWGPSYLAGSRVSPSQNGTYNVSKSPFLRMSLSSDGEIVNFLQLNGEIKLRDDFVKCCQLGYIEDLVSVNVNFVGSSHILVEENYANYYRELGKPVFGRSPSLMDLNSRGDNSEGSSSGELSVTEMYMQFANRISPFGDRAWRRQRRKEKERLGKRRWEPEHFVKIVDCSPTPSRPLQGLWKGICDDINLDFYLVAYDIGGIICRRVGDLSSCSAAPVFWTSNATLIESPFSVEEEYIYDSRIHHHSPAEANHTHCQSPSSMVSHIMHINSSYDLVIRDSAGSFANPRQGEGRIWQYHNGTFGFGFLWDNFIIDLKHMVLDGCLLDAVEV